MSENEKSKINLLEEEKKEEASQEVGRALHVHNEMVMKEICKGGNKSGLYGHMKMLIEKGKEADDSNVQLMNEGG